MCVCVSVARPASLGVLDLLQDADAGGWLIGVLLLSKLDCPLMVDELLLDLNDDWPLDVGRSIGRVINLFRILFFVVSILLLATVGDAACCAAVDKSLLFNNGSCRCSLSLNDDDNNGGVLSKLGRPIILVSMWSSLLSASKQDGSFEQTSCPLFIL